jgi:hypothetical protein
MGREGVVKGREKKNKVTHSNSTCHKTQISKKHLKIYNFTPPNMP